MREMIHNEDNLNDSQITETVIRMKVLLINKDSLYLGYERNVYQFPGGHLEPNETYEDCIKREVMEETGITIKDEDIGRPFFKVTFLSKDWPEVGKNRKAEIYYYAIKTNQEPDLTKVNLTEHEKKGNFEVRKIKLNKVINEIKDNIKNSETNKVIAPDMMEALNEYFKISA